jgi:hypothetical protein
VSWRASGSGLIEVALRCDYLLFNVIVIFSIKSILSDFQTVVAKFPFFFRSPLSQIKINQE